MTYNVFGGTLSLTQSINQSINQSVNRTLEVFTRMAIVGIHRVHQNSTGMGKDRGNTAEMEGKFASSYTMTFMVHYVAQSLLLLPADLHQGRYVTPGVCMSVGLWAILTKKTTDRIFVKILTSIEKAELIKLNFESYLHRDRYSSTLRDTAMFNNLVYIRRKTSWICMKILPYMYPWTRKSC